MGTTSPGEAWESVVGDLRLQRSVEPLEDQRILVRLTFENESEIPLETRIREDALECVDDSTLVTSAGGDPRAWRLVGDDIVHELRVPGGECRTTAYFLEVAGERKPSLSTPRIEHVEPAGAADASDPRANVEQSGVVVKASSPDGSAHNETDDPEASASVVDTLLRELDEAPEEKRRDLRAELGRSPSEVARFEHLRARLDDLAAYVDALETLIDVHGVDVIDEMKERIEENEQRTAALDEEISVLADAIDQHRSRTDDRLESIRADLAEQRTQLDERLTHLEEAFAETRSAVDSVRATQRADRQSRAREIREIEHSLADLEATLDTLEESVDEFEEFHDRFTAAFTADQSTNGQGASSESLREPAENP